MNFFEHQQRARRRTWLLASLFAAAVAVTVVLTNAVVLAALAFYNADPYSPVSPLAWAQANPGAVVWTTIATLGFIGGASLLRMASLRRGGGTVARALGGVPVDPDAGDPRKRQLLNVVEEMAIAAGIPVPEVYLLEQESGINAFAAGHSPSDAAIAVTRGTLEFLTRDELQGVIAHEFSHIFNGDMRLNTRLIGLLYGILVVGLSGRAILRALVYGRTSARRRGGGRFALAAYAGGAALVVIGYVGILCGKLIRAAVSRQRELLADAAAVQFTRNPAGIAGALKKIAVSPLRAVLQSADAEEVGHMLLADGRKLFQAVFATHPPILQRIRAIEPRFDPVELEKIRLVPLAAGRGKTATAPKRKHALPLSPALVIASIGALSDEQIDTAIQREAELPPEAVRAARSRTHAPALVLALALSREPRARALQIERLKARLPERLFPHLDAFCTMVAPLDPVHRLPLIEIAFPALRRHPPEDLKQLVAAIDEAVRADGRYDVLDYALVRSLRVHLSEAAAPPAARLPVRLQSAQREARMLLAVVAEAGGREGAAVHGAYQAGMRALYGTTEPPFAPPRPWIAALDRALHRLDALGPRAKQRLVEALVVTVRHDRRVTLGEVELLRAICASLHCPLPPISVSEDAAGSAGSGIFRTGG